MVQDGRHQSAAVAFRNGTTAVPLALTVLWAALCGWLAARAGIRWEEDGG